MHTRTLRKLALLLTLWLAIHSSSLKAQIFTAPLQASTTGTNPVDFEFRANGIMIAKGNSGVGSLLTGDQGDGTRLLWFPSVGAFRAGGVSTGDSIGTGPWDSAQLGNYSAAFGLSTQASGADTVAFGLASKATGAGSAVAGWYNTASGEYSVAFGGGNTASGGSSVAMGSNTIASGANSFAVGVGNTTSGFGSTAFGSFNIAHGGTSTASGYDNSAWGAGTTVFGAYSTANGANSAAIGSDLTVSAAYSFVTGMYNVGGGNAFGWTSTDPLFEIGNGTSSTHSDAFVVYKNGNADVQGVITAAPGGDIPMYSGN